jgi:Family of unknown function (DUF6515)
MKRSLRLSSIIATLLVAALALESGTVRAEEGRATMHYDRGAVYPATGRMFNEPPHGATAVPHATGQYYYHQGSWYRQNGSHVVVVVPPPGLIVPFLPPFYSTFWFGGYPYFYANEVFYTWQPQVHGYVVTQPPATTDAAVTTPAAELFVYPMKGQDESQQSTDRYECHSWGVAESGFDPVKPQGGVDQSAWPQKREDYQNALAACLRERGYSVR